MSDGPDTADAVGRPREAAGWPRHFGSGPLAEGLEMG